MYLTPDGAENEVYLLCFFSITESRYKSPLDAFIKTIKSEGPLGIFKGTTASWMRLGPGITLYFIIYEKVRWLFGVAPI